MSSIAETRGRKSWALPNMRRLFEASAEEYQSARDKGLVAAGIFYDNITMQFIATYGWHWDIKIDKDITPATPEQWKDIMDHTEVSAEEVELRKAYFKMMRTVSCLVAAHVQGPANSIHAPENPSLAPCALLQSRYLLWRLS